ncbi:MAG: DNA topoisomerase [Lachnospiraceae bacterium]|nr:DNA topoisomerase [Lachnospiraceae bacterium]MDY5742403.1 DNA topoisomerase [Lachnospiraceae bacterium]
MSKQLFITEKPSVAREFARAIGKDLANANGYMEGADTVITWCVGHLVSMSYPEVYDASLKRWSWQTLPFIPQTYRYEVLDGVKKQYDIVERLLNRPDIDCIYVCTDSGREGEYIYRLVERQADRGGSVLNKDRRRVWIDSQTDEEIRRGIAEAKPLSAYDGLAASAYLRAKEDYLMGINFSRAMTLRFGNMIAPYIKKRYAVVSIGRVMTCVLGMVVRREREIRDFVKTPFFKVLLPCRKAEAVFEAEWKVREGSRYFADPNLYKENGFVRRETAEALIERIGGLEPQEAVVESVTKKQEKKNPPLPYNLAELQNDCARLFKISPDQTLQVAQLLYERKLTTYPRTDARVLSTAVAKEITKNLAGLKAYPGLGDFATQILEQKLYTGLPASKYVNDKAITDHYALIPTGQTVATAGLTPIQRKVYELISRRFLSIFYPPAVYQRVSVNVVADTELFITNAKVLKEPGYLVVARPSKAEADDKDGADSQSASEESLTVLLSLRKGERLPIGRGTVKEGETTPPKRYTSGTIILAMENAGQLIEDEALREQIKGSGIGTSSTRAEIIKKLQTNQYISLNSKTQVITPALAGELIFDAVEGSMKQLLNPDLTASWERGLSYVAEGSVGTEEYMQKLERFVRLRVAAVQGLTAGGYFEQRFRATAELYK